MYYTIEFTEEFGRDIDRGYEDEENTIYQMIDVIDCNEEDGRDGEYYVCEVN